MSKPEDRAQLVTLAGTIYAMISPVRKYTPDSAVGAAVQILAAVDAHLNPPPTEKPAEKHEKEHEKEHDKHQRH